MAGKEDLYYRLSILACHLVKEVPSLLWPAVQNISFPWGIHTWLLEVAFNYLPLCSHSIKLYFMLDSGHYLLTAHEPVAMVTFHLDLLMCDVSVTINILELLPNLPFHCLGIMLIVTLPGHQVPFFSFKTSRRCPNLVQFFCLQQACHENASGEMLFHNVVCE